MIVTFKPSAFSTACFWVLLLRLDYNEAYKTNHAEHRQLFESAAKYHSVIDFRDDPVLHKIHLTFRMIYFRVVNDDGNHN